MADGDGVKEFYAVLLFFFSQEYIPTVFWPSD